MARNQIVKKFNPYLLFILLIVFCFFQYGIKKICGFTMYPDEFGYWASAAGAIGYDWSEVASMGSYYSFGYSLILIPILKIFKGGVAAYRVAVAVNMLFICVGMLLLRKLMKKIYPNVSEIKCTFISGIAVMYPPWIFYMQMTLAESLLMLLFILITYLLVCLIKKPSIITAMLLAVTFIYCYSVHMRTVGVILAGLLVLMLWGLNNPTIRRQLLVFLAVLFAAGIVVVFVKRNVISNIFTYADADTLSANDYGSLWIRIKQILSPVGVLELFEEVLAKIFYLGLASFGIFYWTFLWSIKETFLLLKKIIKRKPCYVQNYLATFLFLSIMAEILISSIYMHGSARIDCLIYGRYNEFLMPVVMVFGIAKMYKSRQLIIRTLFAGIVSGLIIPVLVYYVNTNNMEGIRGYFVSGISYVLKDRNQDFAEFLRNAWLVGLGLMLLMAALILVSKKIKGTSWLLGAILTIEVFIGLQVSTNYVYQLNEVIFPDLIISETILREKTEQDTVWYLDEGYWQFIDFQQMQMPDISIHLIRDNELGQMDENGRFLIVYRDSGYHEQFDISYDKKVISSLFVLYYNEI